MRVLFLKIVLASLLTSVLALGAVIAVARTMIPAEPVQSACAHVHPGY